MSYIVTFVPGLLHPPDLLLLHSGDDAPVPDCRHGAVVGPPEAAVEAQHVGILITENVRLSSRTSDTALAAISHHAAQSPLGQLRTDSQSLHFDFTFSPWGKISLSSLPPRFFLFSSSILLFPCARSFPHSLPGRLRKFSHLPLPAHWTDAAICWQVRYGSGRTPLCYTSGLLWLQF